MITPQQLEKAAYKGGWNPYCLAYAIERGLRDPAEVFKVDGTNASYIDWNERRWKDTFTRLNIPSDQRVWAPYHSNHLEDLADRLNRLKGPFDEQVRNEGYIAARLGLDYADNPYTRENYNRVKGTYWEDGWMKGSEIDE